MSPFPDELTVPWGDGELAVSLPTHWSLLPLGAPVLPSADVCWREHLGAALAKPTAGPALGQLLAARAGGKIVLVVEDLTRHSPLAEILDVLLREIRQAGVANERLEIVVAAGMHPPCEPAAMAAKLGPAAAGIPWRWNPWDTPEAYVHVGRVGKVDVRVDRGVADADLRILVSSVSPHLQAGFGGGYKMLLPGCAELASIRRLHRCGIRRRGQGRLVGVEPPANAMRAVIDAAGRMLDRRRGKTFVVEYLLDAENRPTHVAAGEPMTTHRLLTKRCALNSGVLQETTADVVIANAHPRDHDLWQCFKSIPNTCWAARPGGVVICLARCPAGLNEMKQMPFWPLSPAGTRKLVQWLGPETICSLLDRFVARLAGDSQWFIRLAAQLLERNPIFMVSPTLAATGARFPGLAIFDALEPAVAATEAALGPGPKRVALYPHGGATYPVMTNKHQNLNTK
jgi:nickel-dependent lactate racemase